MPNSNFQVILFDVVTPHESVWLQEENIFPNFDLNFFIAVKVRKKLIDPLLRRHYTHSITVHWSQVTAFWKIHEKLFSEISKKLQTVFQWLFLYFVKIEKWIGSWKKA